MHELRGLHILVLRPTPQAQPWATQLQHLGAQVSLLPMMTIAPLTCPQDQQAIKSCILNVDQYDKAIFVSQNAVYHGLQWLDQYWPELPIGIEYFAIGKATADKLAAATPMLLAHQCGQAMNSESLLAHPHLADILDTKIILFAGKGGRGFLKAELEKRGARVDHCALYQRLSPTGDVRLPVAFKQTSAQAVSAAHSGETLQNLCACLCREELQWLQQQPLLVPGQRVARLAQAAGFCHILQAENATSQAMVARLRECL